MTRILMVPSEMLRTAGTLEREAAELAALGAHIPPDAATLMPPDLAADVAGTITRVEVRLASVDARYTVQGGDLARRALTAMADESRWFKPTYKVAKQLFKLLIAIRSGRFITRSRYFPKGRFNLFKYLMGGHRWGYRNGLKSLLKRDLDALRSLARSPASAWRAVTASASKGVAGARRAVNEAMRTAKAILGRGGRGIAVKVGKKLLKKVMLPIAFHSAYTRSHARTTVGRLTSATLSTAAGVLPIVGWLDLGGDVSSGLDSGVSYVESFAGGGDGADVFAAEQRGDYGQFWQWYANMTMGQ